MRFEEIRKNMVGGQLVSRGISGQKVLRAFEKVPRHEFIPEELRQDAYSDYPLPIGEGQTISQPYMVALMTECLGLAGGERVLEVGTGSGYQTAILAEIAGEVYSVERLERLARSAGGNLKRLGYTNISIKVGDGTLGWPEHGPYDGIIVTAGAPGIPEALPAQLKEKGRLVIPIGGGLSQVLTVAEKRGATFSAREVCGCAFVPLIGKYGWAE
ncbi:MAG: protein-L-isoaspartate(D-aspartate) O-methyltransferase [Candidatus Omnitrophota bacterium]